MPHSSPSSSPSSRSVSNRPDYSARLSFWLLVGLLVIVWIAGGASRADVFGQAVVRFFAFVVLIAFALFSARLEWRSVRPVAVLLGLSALLVFLQLVPLPPALWTVLPGRELLVRAAEVSGQPQPWRPLSVSPSATVNALGSLVVPAATLVLTAQLTREQHWRIVALLLMLVLAGCLLALLQFSGGNFGNPFVNYTRGTVSGSFANRNHFALFVAMGCALAPVWGFRTGRGGWWQGMAALALLPFFFLVILATGSRAGLLLGGLGIAAGLFMVRANVLRDLRVMPRWARFAIVGALVAALVSAVALSFFLGRAVSVERALDLQASEDPRGEALPYVIEALARYFPVGSGFGTFDPVYRIGEPDELLRPAYFNRAHNDWLELVLDGGIAAAALLLAALGWWLVATIRVWRDGGAAGMGLARAGSVALLLVMLASIPDYPARTPLVMAIITIMAVWLHQGPRSRPVSPP